MTNRFAAVPKADIQRSSFDRSHGHKTTMEGGYLYPIFLDEGLPGDTFSLKTHAIARLATPLFPVMDNIYVDTHFFAVPMRLLWDNWEKFNGAQDNPADSIDYTIPVISGPINSGDLGDYFGLPLTAVGVTGASCLPFRAYSLIWHEWFRDQNLQLSAAIGTGDGPDAITGHPLQRRGKRHDYFTSCLPWPQKGPAAEVAIMGNGAPTFTFGGDPDPRNLQSEGGTGYVLHGLPFIATRENATWADPALDFTIATLRQATQVQRLLERDARGGTRYTEVIRSHFGVTSPDARFQRPEYLGGFSQPLNISQVHATFTGGTGVQLGDVGGIGTCALDGDRNGFTSSFTEHVIIIGLCSIRADMSYQQRVDKMWTRSTRFDFFWPAFAHIGEQAVLNQEIRFDGNNSVDKLVFGYQERYAEYRYKPSQVTGLFRSGAVGSLDAWHLAFDYQTTPLLNGTFIEEDPPLDRVVAVPGEPKIIIDLWFELRCARPMPMFGVPGMMDHF